MRPGRKPSSIRPVPWLVYVPEDIAAAIELELVDPVSGRVPYAARGKLINQLLRQWFNERAMKSQVPAVSS
jgi:hypothetical protein